MQNTEAMYEDKWNKLCTWDRIKADFPPHFHSYVELLVVKDGVCDVTVDFTEYRMEAGDAVLVFPNVIHSYCAVQSPVKNLTYILPTDFFPLFSDTFAAYRPSNPILKGVYKNAELRAMLDRVNPTCHLEVDGGVDLVTAEVCKANGADVLVAGSACLGAADIPAFVAAIEA